MGIGDFFLAFAMTAPYENPALRDDLVALVAANGDTVVNPPALQTRAAGLAEGLNHRGPSGRGARGGGLREIARPGLTE